jgi:hypothetical protein
LIGMLNSERIMWGHGLSGGSNNQNHPRGEVIDYVGELTPQNRECLLHKNAMDLYRPQSY